MQGFQNLVGIKRMKNTYKVIETLQEELDKLMKLEVLQKEYYYYIYNRGINSTLFFNNDENKRYFLTLVKKYFISKIEIISYCLMDNHFHFVIKVIGKEKEVTQSLSNLFNAYAKAYNKQNSRTGSLFEKHFKRIRINDEEYLRKLIIYVHLKPLYHLGDNFEKYSFSSYGILISKKDTMINREEVLELFSGLENFIFNHRQKRDTLSEKYTFE